MSKKKGTMRLRRSATPGRQEEWEVTYGGVHYRVTGNAEAAATRLRELSSPARPKART